jgi:peptide deformylase
MSVKTIIQHPSKILRTKSTKVKDFKEATQIAEDLSDTLENSTVPGIGLSAPQIGVNKRVFVIRKYKSKGKKETYEEIVMINPKIIRLSKRKERSLEGCLSINDVYGYLERHKQIKIKYTGLDKELHQLGASGLVSHVIQHENDHLDGILFIDKLINNKTYSEAEIDKLIEMQK